MNVSVASTAVAATAQSNASRQPAVAALAARLVDEGPVGLRRMKQLLNDGWEQPIDVGLRNKRIMVEPNNDSHRRRKGLAACAERRPHDINGSGTGRSRGLGLSSILMKNTRNR